MPIKPENKGKYPPNWREISLRIRARANNCCETCGVPNGALITRSTVDAARWCMDDPQTGGCLTDRGQLYKWSEAPAEFQGDKLVKVVLTVAHLNHDEADCSDENLKALCQRCHLTYDAQHHASNAALTRSAKKQQAAQEAGQQNLFEDQIKKGRESRL